MCALLTLLLAGLPRLCLGQQPSPNLLANSGFELGRTGDARLRQWAPPPERPGLLGSRTGAFAHSGSACARLEVGPQVEVNWWQIYQRITRFSGKTPYTLSAWVKTEGISDGAGAYISLSYFDSRGERTGFKDSDVRLTGTHEWTRLVTTCEVPPQSSEMRAIVLLHGHGVAYFDDVQLQAGTVATDWQPSRADVEAEQRMQVAQAAADEYFRQVGYERAEGRDVAILKDDFPKLGAPSDPDVLARALQAGGLRTYFVSGEQLANPAILQATKFDLVVLPYGRAFPAAARETFQDYLSSGGCFLSMGGYAFDEQLIRAPEGWVSPKSRARSVGSRVVTLLDFEDGEVTDWSLGSGPGGPKPILALDCENPGQGRRSLMVTVPAMKYWATAVTPTLAPERFFEGWRELVFRARGDASTPKMIVEWHERDGTRWKTSVDLTADWKEHVLLPGDFKYWPDSTSKGRGGPGDRPDLGNMQAILFGFSLEVVKDGGDYTVWLDDIRISDDPQAGLDVDIQCMNTRHCRIQDAMWPEQEQIGVFDPSHELRNAVTAHFTEAAGEGLAGKELQGPFKGMAAVGVLSTQGHGFGPDNSRIVPLVESFDPYGRPRGALGSMMLHFGGYFRGSAWGFFGVESEDLFSEKHPEMLKLLPQVARRLIDRVFLFGTEAQYNCYQAGEKARVITRVANFGRTPQRRRVDLRVTELQGGGDYVVQRGEVLTVAPGTVAEHELEWAAPEKGTDLYRIEATLHEVVGGDGLALVPGPMTDREENAVVVWRDEVVAKGPRPVIKDTYFYQGDVPRYLLGCQNWWGTNGSISQRRTLDWERDFQMMQDLGLHISRCFLPWQTEEQKRASDAWVYLAQKHGIVMFHTPNLAGTADPQVLAEECARARDIAQRYRDVLGLIVDTCNETGVRADDSEGQRAAFNEWLQRRYKTDEALKEAWGDDPPERPMPDVPFRWPAQKWDSVRALDVSQFAIQALSQWSTETRNAFRSERPDLAVTAGWGQGFGWGPQMFDPPLASRDQDFTNQHYYGELAQFPLYMKPLDRRWSGQPISVGECGARQHPSFDGGETEEQYARRFLYLQHHAFGMGMAFCASWHWRDPMAGIFPFGKVHSDFVLRDAALVERNQALLFGGLHPKYEPAPVYLLLPDAHRLGGDNSLALQAIHTAVDTLLGLHARFECVCEADLDRLPKDCRALIWPVPCCPSDETFETVMRFVEAGGSLLVTGDVGYDEQRRWTRQERIRRLTGARSVVRNAQVTDFRSSRPVQVQCMDEFFGVPEYSGRPSVSLNSVDADVLARDDRGAIITLKRMGRGQVLFVGEFLELETGVPRREIYGTFLHQARGSWLVVEPDRADIHAFRLATLEGGEVLVAHNGGPTTRVTVAGLKQKVELDLAQGLPGMCVLDADGQVYQAEAQGEVQVGNKTVMATTGHVAIMTLDGKPLGESRELAILPFAPGTVTVAARADGLIAQVGEVRKGQWRVLRDGVPTQAGIGGATIECDQAMRLEVVLVAEQGKMEEAGRKIANRLALW